MECKERGSHARAVYLTQGTSRMRTASVKQEERHRNNSKRVVRNLEERNVDTTKKSSKGGLTSADNLTIMLPESRDSYYK